MADSEKTKDAAEDVIPTSGNPLVFISHDSRDAELAEAFGKLLKSVSTGMIKTFRSSDRKGADGIDFGEEWYKRLMTALQSTSDVVCIFTERSLDRPWILFEAGVAKGKLNTPVVGVACGIPLAKISAGPFYQFQNMDDSEADLAKLIQQLAKRIPGLELDADVVKGQIAAFKKSEADILAKLGSKKTDQESSEENSIAKLAEELKALPSRVAERLNDDDGRGYRRKRFRRLHPGMFHEMMHMVGEPGDPLTLLIIASMVREDVPWLYELVMEVYRAVKSGDPDAIEREVHRLERFSDQMMHGPFIEEFGMGDKETYIMLREFPRMLQRFLDEMPLQPPSKAKRGLRPKPTEEPRND
jgi:hypothetical protein